MNMPEIELGQLRTSELRIVSDIPEQLILSKRMADFAMAASLSGVAPAQVDRFYGDIRVDQPAGKANVSFGYSEDQSGRSVMEVHATHVPQGDESHFALINSGSYWHHTQNNKRYSNKKAPRSEDITHQQMIDEMLEYTDHYGSTAGLMDTIPTARLIQEALVDDLAPKARQQTAADHYVVNTYTVGGDDYASSRKIELIEKRKNRFVTRSLALSAFIMIGDGPIQIAETLTYKIAYKGDGTPRDETVSLSLSSRDGVSAHHLRRLAESSDVIQNAPIVTLHKALDHLEGETRSAAA